MKKLLSTLLLCFCFSSLAQTPCLFNYCDEPEMPNTDNNMSVVFAPGKLDDYVGGTLQAYIADSPVSDISHIGAEADNYVYNGVTVIGTDYQCGCDLADLGETIQFVIFMNGNVILIDVNPPITYAANAFEMVSGSLSFTINNGANVLHGCMDNNYLEFNPFANIDNGSCQEIRVDGCTDILSCVYNEDANFDDGSCIYETEQSLFNTCCLDNLVTSICPSEENCATADVDCVNLGCMSSWADNFDVFVNEDDGSCYKMGCTEDWADNYDNISTENDGSCSLESCTSPWADNYDSNATIDDGSCIYSQDYVNGLWNEVDDGAIEFNEAVESLSSLQQALNTWNTTIDLSAGWNMFGYGCPNPINIAEGLSNHTESISITKDNNGNVYMPEFSFNGIGDLTPGFGYQIKLTEAIEGFSLCDWYVNDIPEDNIVSLQDSLELINSQIGCTDSSACNYDTSHIYDDSSCIYSEEAYDCNGGFSPEVGDFTEGGIVFYVDSTGIHGLVASLEDLSETYEWGCWNVNVNGALSAQIGSGYQNTIDIVNSNCLLGGDVTSGANLFSGINAAEACFDFEYDGYSDWYLPSKDEFDLLFTNIGPLSGIIGHLNAEFYRVSTQFITSGNLMYKDSWVFYANSQTWNSGGCRCYSHSVRPIRSF